MTLLIPAWFVLLAASFWRRSGVVGMRVFNLGAALKVLWSFHLVGDSAWSIIPPVLFGAAVCNGAILYVLWRRSHSGAPTNPAASSAGPA